MESSLALDGEADTVLVSRDSRKIFAQSKFIMNLD